MFLQAFVILCTPGGRLPLENGLGGLPLEVVCMEGADPPPPRYGQPAVGAHPTGMHSCLSRKNSFSREKSSWKIFLVSRAKLYQKIKNSSYY